MALLTLDLDEEFVTDEVIASKFLLRLVNYEVNFRMYFALTLGDE